ncbi:Meiotic recombination protein dmc1 [Trifolium repens]|nr:Meiotic recombination protein dmc1 [Trifolium repens]
MSTWFGVKIPNSIRRGSTISSIRRDSIISSIRFALDRSAVCITVVFAEGGFVDDFLSNLMCCCCALVQEWREVEIRGVLIGEYFCADCLPISVCDCKIIYACAYTYEHQCNLLLGLAAKMAKEPFKLLIVDSVIALFRVDFTGRGEFAEHQVSRKNIGE